MRPTKEDVDRITKSLVDQGKVIEAGWKGYEMIVVPVDASTVQRSECRQAFYAGAQHLFGSINSILDDDREPTQRDLRRMTLIHEELERFVKDFKLQHLMPSRGRA